MAWIEGARGGGDIRIAPLDDPKKSERVTAASKPDEHCRENGITWEPDSKALAFFSDCAEPGDQADLYLSHLDGSAARRLTELRGYEEAPAFSPDGSKVAFLYVEGATRPAGALAAMKPPAGVIGEDGVEIQRVAVVPVNATAPLSSDHRDAGQSACLRVRLGGRIRRAWPYVAADPPGENNWWVAKLYTQALGGEAKADSGAR